MAPPVVDGKFDGPALPEQLPDAQSPQAAQQQSQFRPIHSQAHSYNLGRFGLFVN